MAAGISKASRTSGRASGRKRGPARAGGRRAWWWRLAALVALLAMVGGAWGWWHLRHWQPDRTAYPYQGVEVGAADGPVDWTAVHAIGADFAYVDASDGATARDPAATVNLDGARAARLKVGALHRYDPCVPADRQAANFVTVVPRDPKMLPPAVELVRLAENCPSNVTDAAVISELMTFLNQIETHTGKAAILKVGPAFEARYHIARALDTRNVWLMRDRFQPDYAGRPWTMWTANSALMTKAGDEPLHWVVVQP